jgi:hypothetical protein
MPGKFATMNPIAPPDKPPTTLQNFPVGEPPPSAIPSSLSISSNTSPNCSLSNFSFSASLLALNPKLAHGNPPPPAAASASGPGVPSSLSKAVEEAPEE